MLTHKLLPSSHAARQLWSSVLLLSTLLFAQDLHPAQPIRLSPAETQQIGRKVWQNECNGTLAGLTSWNEGENFASLGIGHFIWYPRDVRGPFAESFPKFVVFAAAHKVKFPKTVDLTGVCPWNNRSEFERDSQTVPIKELRGFLAETVDLQAEFLVLRLQESLSKMLAAAEPARRDHIRRQFDAVARSSNGYYALVDYVNFKGEGVLATERYAGQGWGLLQVLEGMPQEITRDPVRRFAESAKKVLSTRVLNSPSARREGRWLPGWIRRIETYLEN